MILYIQGVGSRQESSFLQDRCIFPRFLSGALSMIHHWNMASVKREAKIQTRPTTLAQQDLIVRSSPTRDVMTLSKCAKLGFQVQSVVARVNFLHERNSRFISNSRGTIGKALVVLLPATYKIIPCSCVPNFTEWLSSTRREYK
jgi:hypothetical protein